jgi:hypothetical protein
MQEAYYMHASEANSGLCRTSDSTTVTPLIDMKCAVITCYVALHNYFKREQRDAYAGELYNGTALLSWYYMRTVSSCDTMCSKLDCMAEKL